MNGLIGAAFFFGTVTALTGWMFDRHQKARRNHGANLSGHYWGFYLLLSFAIVAVLSYTLLRVLTALNLL